MVAVSFRVVFGSEEGVKAALEASQSSRSINTSFIERQNGTDRHRSSRKVRKTCGFSKKLDYHDAATYFSMYSYNFCWPVRTLRERDEAGNWQARTPAMVVKLTDHVWLMSEWASTPVVQYS